MSRSQHILHLYSHYMKTALIAALLGSLSLLSYISLQQGNLIVSIVVVLLTAVSIYLYATRKTRVKKSRDDDPETTLSEPELPSSNYLRLRMAGLKYSRLSLRLMVDDISTVSDKRVVAYVNREIRRDLSLLQRKLLTSRLQERKLLTSNPSEEVRILRLMMVQIIKAHFSLEERPEHTSKHLPLQRDEQTTDQNPKQC